MKKRRGIHGDLSRNSEGGEAEFLKAGQEAELRPEGTDLLRRGYLLRGGHRALRHVSRDVRASIAMKQGMKHYDKIRHYDEIKYYDKIQQWVNIV